jgi:hypothetical protein
MRRGVFAPMVLLAGALRAVGQEPAPTPPTADALAAPEPGPAASPAPAEAPASPEPAVPGEPAAATPAAPTPEAATAPAPPPPALDPSLMPDPARGVQPMFGPPRRPWPAQAIASMEAGEPLLPGDARVDSVAVLISRLTERYVEAAPAIAARAERVVRDIRGAGAAASPVEMLAAAERWRGPGDRKWGVPRRFEEFARLYRKGRVEEKLEHAAALARMQPGNPSPTPVPSP